jgi:cellulose synthase/poly-beta-1,6-N-acetylglucosamine synthase-like glycosyltransferase
LFSLRKGIRLVPSLSLLLPIHNAEAILAESLCRLLEFLPDMAERFEVLIVDDGSTDSSLELADEFARRFPQVRAIGNKQRRGIAAAAQSGLAHASGDFVVVHDLTHPLSARDLQALWDLRHEEGLVSARTAPRVTPLDSGLVSRLINWGRGVEQAEAQRRSTSGTQLIRRAAIAELERHPQQRGELEVAREGAAEKIRRIAPRRKSGPVLSQVNDFALGE